MTSLTVVPQHWWRSVLIWVLEPKRYLVRNKNHLLKILLETRLRKTNRWLNPDQEVGGWIWQVADNSFCWNILLLSERDQRFEFLSLKCHTTTRMKRKHKTSALTPTKLSKAIWCVIYCYFSLSGWYHLGLSQSIHLSWLLVPRLWEMIHSCACEVPASGACSPGAHKGHFCLNHKTIGLGGCSTFRVMARESRKHSILIDAMEHINIFQANQIPSHIFLFTVLEYFRLCLWSNFGFCFVSLLYLVTVIFQWGTVMVHLSNHSKA